MSISSFNELKHIIQRGSNQLHTSGMNAESSRSHLILPTFKLNMLQQERTNIIQNKYLQLPLLWQPRTLVSSSSPDLEQKLVFCRGPKTNPSPTISLWRSLHTLRWKTQTLTSEMPMKLLSGRRWVVGF